MKSSSLLSTALLFTAPALLSAGVQFTDNFRGSSLDPAHWEIKGQNGTGRAQVGGGSLEINGGPLSPDNNSQGWFLHNRLGWDTNEKHTISLTFLPPNITTQSGAGVQSLVSWLWISNDRPTSASMTLATNPALLVKLYHGIGGVSYQRVEVYSKTSVANGEGTMLWSGRYLIGDDPTLKVTVGIDHTHYEVDFDREMYQTTGALSGTHHITFNELAYANLGGSNSASGRGETHFIDFSIAAPIPEPGTAALLLGGGLLGSALRRRMVR